MKATTRDISNSGLGVDTAREKPESKHFHNICGRQNELQYVTQQVIMIRPIRIFARINQKR
jgi:hypothetical protein